MAAQTLAGAQRKINSLEKKIKEQEAAFQARITEIGERAMDAADTHGWCDEVKELLEELDIPVPSSDQKVTVRLEVQVDLNTGLSEDGLRDAIERAGYDLKITDIEGAEIQGVEVQEPSYYDISIH